MSDMERAYAQCDPGWLAKRLVRAEARLMDLDEEIGRLKADLERARAKR